MACVRLLNYLFYMYLSIIMGMYVTTDYTININYCHNYFQLVSIRYFILNKNIFFSYRK